MQEKNISSHIQLVSVTNQLKFIKKIREIKSFFCKGWTKKNYN